MHIPLSSISSSYSSAFTSKKFINDKNKNSSDTINVSKINLPTKSSFKNLNLNYAKNNQKEKVTFNENEKTKSISGQRIPKQKSYCVRLYGVRVSATGKITKSYRGSRILL